MGLTELLGSRAGGARTGDVSRKPLWWERLDWLGTAEGSVLLTMGGRALWGILGLL